MTDVTPATFRDKLHSYILTMQPHGVERTRTEDKLLIESEQTIDDLADCLRRLVNRLQNANHIFVYSPDAFEANSSLVNEAEALLKRIGK